MCLDTSKKHMHYVPKHRLLRFIKTVNNQLMGWVTKLLYDTYNQPNVEILLGQCSEIEKIGDLGERGSKKAQ